MVGRFAPLAVGGASRVPQHGRPGAVPPVRSWRVRLPTGSPTAAAQARVWAPTRTGSITCYALITYPDSRLVEQNLLNLF